MNIRGSSRGGKLESAGLGSPQGLFSCQNSGVKVREVLLLERFSIGS